VLESIKKNLILKCSIGILEREEDVELSLDDRKLLDMGRQDTTTSVTVSVTVYTTPEFR
jgi:hypothetical protein